MVYDLLIIGAGINGAGLAQVAASRGFSVMVLEKNDNAGLATSANSSKLVHGGLRYLESGHFKMVFTSLAERKHMLETLADLVKLKPFYIPIYNHSARPPWKIWLGLFLYYALSKFSQDNRFRLIPQKDWSNMDGLNTKNLRALFKYYDAQTDDAKLTQEVLRQACQAGAKVKFQHEVSNINLTDVASVVTCDNGYQIKAKVIVNAAGPWVNHLLDLVNPTPVKIPVDLVQGVHIVIPGTLQHGMYYVEALDKKRVIFIMPWQGNILVGTTEKEHTGTPQSATASDEEIDYLLSTYNFYFPSGKIERKDVKQVMCGLRVLPATAGAVFSRSREMIAEPDRENKPRLITIYGGKLTSWRSTAESVMNLIYFSPTNHQQTT